MSLMNIVLFDIDHTLMASATGANARASRKMFQQVFGLETSEDSVEKVGMTEWGLIEKVLAKAGAVAATSSPHRQIPERAYTVWADELHAELRQDGTSRVLPGIVELLDVLRGDSQIRLALLTGNSIWRSRVKLAAVGLLDYFTDRDGNLLGAFGNDARTREALLTFAFDRLVFEGDCATVIDDSLIGAKMLADKKVHSVFVATGEASVSELKQYQNRVYPDFGENRWREVAEFVKSCQLSA